MNKKICTRCHGTGNIRSHTPSKEKMMFGLLDFGISAVFESLKGRVVDCPDCDGYGYF